MSAQGRPRARAPSFVYPTRRASGARRGFPLEQWGVSIMRGYLGKTAWVAAAVLLADGVALPGAWGQTAPPAALVGEVWTGVTGVEALDYVSAGRQIQLGGSGKSVLGY